MKDGLTWLNNSRPNGFVEDGALTLDPMLGPSGRDIRSIPDAIPREREEGLSRIQPAEVPGCAHFPENSGAFGDKDDLVALKNSTMRPFKMVIGRMPCRRILRMRSYSRKAD